MTRLRAASSADRTNDRFCERCGNQADPATTLSRVGLTTCRVCGLHACQRCWARSVGWCPACGASMVATPLLRSLPAAQRRDGAARPVPAAVLPPGSQPHPRRARSRLPVLAAAGAAAVVAATAFAFVFGVPIGPTGGVAGVTGTPGAAGLGGLGLGNPTPSSAGSPSGATPRPGRTPAPTPRRGTPGAALAVPDPTPRAPDPTTAPTPRRTPRPTPRPTPRSTPAPTRCVAIAPNLVGQHRNGAGGLWSAAGFTGAVTALGGHGNYLIASQDRTPGASYPCSAGVTIGP